MARMKTVFRCTDCGGAAPKWAGRCAACGEWNTLVEEQDEAAGSAAGGALAGRPDVPQPISDVSAEDWHPRPTGLAEVDRVLSGGFVPGSVTLLGGEPGTGKSTLLLQVVAALAAQGATALYVSAEESKQQVRLRAERLDTLRPDLWLAAETALPHVIAHLDEIRPDVLVLDSIQTVFDPELSSAPGSVAQVRECAARLVREAKTRAMSVILVGHVTKDGALAGPRVLEHLVDTVLSFEGDRHHGLRLLRAVKHRFGATAELGLFEMGEDGLRAVPDASALFLTDRCQGVPGSVVVPTIEGHRPLLVEVQALVAPTALPTPRRSAQGVDGGRLALLTAVLQQRAGVSTAMCDVYALAVGGARVSEPAADLGLALAIASSAAGVAMPSDLLAVGEVGLGGEVRQVAQLDRRLAEGARLGFTRAVVPASAKTAPDGVAVERVGTIREAIERFGLTRQGGERHRGAGSPT
jgi:DNA repair protein RadA/Sms